MNNRALQPTGLWGWSWELRLTRGIGRVISASLPAEQPGLSRRLSLALVFPHRMIQPLAFQGRFDETLGC